MNRALPLMLMAMWGCSNSSVPVDASTDGGATDATGDAGDAAEASTPCKTGLPSADTSGVVCGTVTCTSPQVCCISNLQCASSCGNLDLAWACDRSGHCGANMTCCYGIGPDFSTCPAKAESTAPLCQSATTACTDVVCQTDSDCMSGQTCYALTIEVAQDAGLDARYLPVIGSHGPAQSGLGQVDSANSRRFSMARSSLQQGHGCSSHRTGYFCMTVVNLTLKRLDRLEKSSRETNVLLGRVVTILETHSRHFERVEDALIAVAERVDGMSARIDRLTTAIARGRTQDLTRFDEHDRRIRALERRRHRS